MKYADIIKFIKSEKGVEFANVLDLHEFVVEERITTKGKYVVKLEFDAKQALKNPNSVPRCRSDFNYVPFLLFIKFKTLLKPKDLEEERI